jgi:hypothetical protein
VPIYRGRKQKPELAQAQSEELREGFSALDVALSFYNSGNSLTGFRNGYVATVYAHAPELPNSLR